MAYNKILEKVNSNESAVGLNLAINSPHLVEFLVLWDLIGYLLIVNMDL